MKQIIFLILVLIIVGHTNYCEAKYPLITYKLLQKSPFEVEIDGQKITAHVKVFGDLMPGKGKPTK